MEEVQISHRPPSDTELKSLRDRARQALDLLRRDDCEIRRPLFVEFAGSPKSGKSTIIGILSHFFRRIGFDVVQPAEGASLRTPATLRDDWFAFNAWSGCYALRNILELAHERFPSDLVILDRGLFDVASWMAFLQVSEGRITEEDRDVVTQFFALDLWREREQAVFLFTADRETSIRREIDCKLTDDHGTVMNPETLSALQDAYRETAERLDDKFRIWNVDTSLKKGKNPNFQRIAFSVGQVIVNRLHELLDQRLLVTDRVDAEGLVLDVAQTEDVIADILKDGTPNFMARTQAEASGTVQQVVPYALLNDSKGDYFFARRRSDHPRAELQGKYTMLVGGHAEEKDWDKDDPDVVFEHCLRRELEEELIGLRVVEIKRLGFINDTWSASGTKHLAILYCVKVGGSPKIRRQAADQEFGREPVSWKSADEIKSHIGDLDPWSRLVANGLLGAEMPEIPGEPTLFTRNKED